MENWATDSQEKASGDKFDDATTSRNFHGVLI
jgi:hypothetical protein